MAKHEKSVVVISLDHRSAPIAVLEDSRLSAESKLLLTWLFMHGNGWEFVISYALRWCGISETMWHRKVRRELIAAGYFKQSRTGRGWDNVVDAAPAAEVDCSTRRKKEVPA